MRRLHSDSTWSVIDADGAAVLFVRNTVDHREIIAEAAHRLRGLNAHAAISDEVILPPRNPSWLAAWVRLRRPSFGAEGRGNAFVQLDMIEAARREYRRALLAPDVPEPGLMTAYVLVNEALGRTDEARAWCRKLVEIAPHDELALTVLARLGHS